MKILATLSLSITCLFFLTSCNNDDLDLSSSNEVNNTETFSFVYKGINYSSPYHFDKDSTIILGDTEVNELYKQLKNLPELVTFVNENSVIEFFDNYDQAIELITNRPSLRIATGFQPFQYIILEFYDKPAYQGNSYICDWNFSHIIYSGAVGGDFDIPTINFYKKASSLKIKTNERSYRDLPRGFGPYYYLSYNIFLRENIYTGGQSLIFSKYPSDADGNIYVEDLKKYGWNKRVARYDISLGYGGDYSKQSTADSRVPNEGGGSSDGRHASGESQNPRTPSGGGRS